MAIPADTSPILKARIAGGFYLITVAGSIYSYVIAPGTGVGHASGLVAGTANLVVTLLLYDLLRPVNPLVALLAVFFNLEGSAHDHDPLAFFGCFCLCTGYLIYKSTFMPRLLGAAMTLAGLGLLTNAYSPLLIPSFAHQLSPITSANLFGAGGDKYDRNIPIRADSTDGIDPVADRQHDVRGDEVRTTLGGCFDRFLLGLSQRERLEPDVAQDALDRHGDEGLIFDDQRVQGLATLSARFAQAAAGGIGRPYDLYRIFEPYSEAMHAGGIVQFGPLVEVEAAVARFLAEQAACTLDRLGSRVFQTGEGEPFDILDKLVAAPLVKIEDRHPVVPHAGGSTVGLSAIEAR